MLNQFVTQVRAWRTTQGALFENFDDAAAQQELIDFVDAIKSAPIATTGTGVNPYTLAAWAKANRHALLRYLRARA